MIKVDVSYTQETEQNNSNITISSFSDIYGNDRYDPEYAHAMYICDIQDKASDRFYIEPITTRSYVTASDDNNDIDPSSNSKNSISNPNNANETTESSESTEATTIRGIKDIFKSKSFSSKGVDPSSINVDKITLNQK